MSVSFLDDMIARRQARIAAEFGDLTAHQLAEMVASARPVRGFTAALTGREDVAVIAEIKKASPSLGVIAPGCDAAAQARAYEAGGAAAISVLTEPESFGGSFGDLATVASVVEVPVLCKDFVVDPVQVHLARGYGADAVLLMVSVLGEAVGRYIAIAEELGLTPLVEVATHDELKIARFAGAEVVAVNSRDLHTLEVNRVHALRLVGRAASAGLTIVAASGVSSPDDVAVAGKAEAHAVLIGGHLMKSADPEAAVRELTGVARRTLGGW